MNKSYTKGAWQPKRGNLGVIMGVPENLGYARPIAQVVGPNPKERDANALLICKAPVMLGLLERIYQEGELTSAHQRAIRNLLKTFEDEKVIDIGINKKDNKA